MVYFYDMGSLIVIMGKTEMKHLKLAVSIGLLVGSFAVNAAQVDVNVLNEKVQLKVQQLDELGLLPSSLEIEVVTGDIVDKEVELTELTVEQAIEKYELTPTLERYILIKEAGRVGTLGGGVVKVPPN
jgi:hypothetical protein